MEDRVHNEVWWWNSLWKFHDPPKCIILMWLILVSNILTWDNLHKCNWKGPSFCILCNNCGEDKGHLFIQCKYTIGIWKEVLKALNIQTYWPILGVEVNLKEWFTQNSLKRYCAFPFIIPRSS